MKFRHYLLLVMAMVLGGLSSVAKEQPKFSSDSEEFWYYLSYPNTGKVIQDMGDGNAMQSAAPRPDDRSQMWKLVGTAEQFVLVSGNGGYAYKDGPFRTAADSGKGVNFTLIESNIGNCWMINYPGDGWGCLNQYSNGTIDGYWSDADDANNAIEFLDPAAVTGMPKFSDVSGENWYYMSFATDGSGITDNGAGNGLISRTMKRNDKAQQWKLVGTADGFKLVSGTGNYVRKDGPFKATDSEADAHQFTLIKSDIADHWQVKYTGDDWGCINQYEATRLDGWYADGAEKKNAIRFVEADKVLNLPLFSTDTEEHWYYISYANGGKVFQDNGSGKSITTVTIKTGEDAQLWKLVGDAENFKLISKLGNCVYKDGPFRTSGDATKAINLTLEKAGNPEFDDFLQINYKGDGWGIMNQYSNGEVNGYYNDPGDQNNALSFINPADVSEPLDMSHIKEFAVEGSTSFVPSHRATLWYTNPVTAETVENPWMEYALPIGNGEFGAMVYGGIHCEQLQFNDKSVWTGNSHRRGCYQNFGDVFIEDVSGVFENGKVLDYVRYLDMNDGVAGVSYKSADGTAYTREYLASYPDKVVAVKLAASEKGRISVRLRLRNNIKIGFVSAKYADGTASFGGKLDLVDFKAVLKAVPVGGTMTTTSDYIEVSGADELVLVLAAGTNFDQNEPTYISDAAAMASNIESRAEHAAAKSWSDIRADHVADFASYFGRVDFQLDGAANAMTTKNMVDSYSSSTAAARMLEELYFNYGRYLLISSSRGMDTPANLQGIWNNSDNPAWQSDIHSNINVQMNYWLAENTNLPEMHMPYLNYIYSMAIDHEEWKSYARKSGQTEGWTCFTQNNIFGHSDYAENYVIANAWYTSHLWQHYRYTLDRDFLRTRALPVMLSCTKFWLERLVEASDGTLVAPKEWSPEHGPQEEDGTAHAQQIVAELFESTLQAIRILGADAGVDQAFIDDLTAKYAKLDKGLAIEQYTGAWGSPCNGIASGTDILREWKYSAYSVGQNGHRHQSHLMAMYPFGAITPESGYFAPAVNSLKLRSDASTGWSLAWRVNLWARALDGDHAHTIIRNALKHSTSYGIKENKGGVYYNLFDSHAPFQIDGNFGYSAGVAELLLQSYDGAIRLLPALPTAWATGSMNGLRAIGNFEVDQTWADKKLTKATVRSFSGSSCSIIYPNIAKATVTDANGAAVKIEATGTDRITFATQAGASYTILTDGNTGVEEVAAGSLALTIDNGIVTVNAADVVISAYDLRGVCLKSVDSNVADLTAYAGSPLIIKASTGTDEIVRKCCF